LKYISRDIKQLISDNKSYTDMIKDMLIAPLYTLLRSSINDSCKTITRTTLVVVGQRQNGSTLQPAPLFRRNINDNTRRRNNEKEFNSINKTYQNSNDLTSKQTTAKQIDLDIRVVTKMVLFATVTLGKSF